MYYYFSILYSFYPFIFARGANLGKVLNLTLNQDSKFTVETVKLLSH